jgi:hypothetical protein
MAPTKKGKSIFLHYETAFLAVILVAALVITTTLFFLLWNFLKIGFVWIICFLIFFMIRKTNLWKFSIEVHFFMIFVTTFVFGWLFSVSLFIVTLFVVVKFFRPDELQGAIINLVCLAIVTGLTVYLASVYGMTIAASTFVWVATAVVAIGIVLDYLMILRIFPFMWMKLTMMHILECFLQYYFISAIGFKIFKFLLSVKTATP